MKSIVVVVDPYSTGRALVGEAVARDYDVVALWSWEHRGGSFEGASIDEQPSLSETISELLAACRGGDIAAVVCGGDDGITLTDSVAEELKLEGHGVWPHGRRRGDKLAQHEALASCKLRSARNGAMWKDVVDGDGDVVGASHEAAVVVKLREGTGSEGAKVCRSLEEANEHADHLQRLGAGHDSGGRMAVEVLVQEYLEGTEYVVDCVSRRGEHKATMLWQYDKRPANGASFVYYGEAPVASDSEVGRALVQYTFAALDALGIVSGPTHSEVIWSEQGGPCLVECNVRCHGGDGVWLPLAQALTGYHQVGCALDALLDQAAFDAIPTIPNSPYRVHGAFLCLASYERGQLVGTPGFDTIRELPSCHELRPMVGVGEMLEPSVDLFTVPAMLTLWHEDEEVVAADVQAVRTLESERRIFALAKQRTVRRKVVPFQ